MKTVSVPLVLSWLAVISWSILVAQAMSAAPGAGGLHGQVRDPSGASIPGATVTVTGAGKLVRTAATDEQGRYTIAGLPPGKYDLAVASPGFARFRRRGIKIAAGQNSAVNIHLRLQVEKQQVTVSTRQHVSVEPSQNVGALVLKGRALEALSDNPEDLQSELQALAGPSAGPNGGQIYIDGFTGGQLPPKSSIREIRINQNPFSAQHDKLGYGRIEILTKPGTNSFHGQGYFRFGDSIFNSRNPFASFKPPYQSKTLGGNFSGPISKKASFFLDAQRRSREETSVVNALTLDKSLNITPFSTAILNPTMRTTISPRIDYQLSTNNTLTARYRYRTDSRVNEGIGVFSLPSRAYNGNGGEHLLQLSETAVLSTKIVNETHFRYIRSRNNQWAHDSEPTIRVLGAFTGGGSDVGVSYNNTDRYELQNLTSMVLGTHMLKFGGRLRDNREVGRSTQNYNGTFIFTSLAAYQKMLEGLRQGLPMAQIRANGGGPGQFSLTAGNPLAGINQFDIGLFAQDDWRVRSNFTLSLGLRYETQNNIDDHRDIAPRVAFAWGFGKSRKTVLRAGFGLFYDRFSEGLTLEAIRLNGIRQQRYIVPFPGFYPNVPPPESLAAHLAPSAIREVDRGLRAPYMAQTAVKLERQLSKDVSLSLTYINTRGIHMLRSRNINAPLPGTYNPKQPDSGLRPYGSTQNIYLYESSGIFKQNQFITRINANVNSKLILFGFYVLNEARSDTDGAGSFPADSYNLATEYGRAGFDVRHRAFLGGSIMGPLGLRFSPFMVVTSGHPYNITLGRDLNGDSLYSDRPAFVTDLTRPGVVVTPYGAFDTRPAPGETIIPRNYGDGPGLFFLNLRLSRTFGFGGERSPSAGASAGGGSRRHHGGGDGLRSGFHSIFGGGNTRQRYNLTFSILAHNLLNNVNVAPPVGNLSSPLFGTSNALAGGFGHFGSTTANRRIILQMRFSF